mmetsp:Transcript_36267/g.92674  ORF Transcript_36267/g.92674 Transcript_36267/m.92674 type:complete len:409 (+) Transcript_36267:207-1433(+)
MGPATAQHATTAGATRSPTALPGSWGSHRRSAIGRPRGAAVAPCASSAQDAGISEMRPLGKSGLSVSSMGIGSRKWGDTSEGYGSRFTEEDLSLVFETAISMGCTFFDCDETYGYQSLPAGQQAEQLLGRQKALWSHPARPEIIVGTKYCPLPWANSFVGGEVRGGKEGMVPALQASLERLGSEKADLWQIQNPVDARNAEFMEGLADAVEMGLVRSGVCLPGRLAHTSPLCSSSLRIDTHTHQSFFNPSESSFVQVRAVGVSNFNTQQLEDAIEALGKRGIPLASNQVRYSILHRAPERDGMLELCQQADVALIAHSPLDGRLAAAPDTLPPDEAAIMKLLEFLGAVAHGGKSAAQVALNYLLCKGAIPIPGCTTPSQAEGLLGAMGWRLEEDDLAVIDEKLTYHKY